MIFKFDDSQALQQFNQYNRKDSGSSEVAAFLNPSGRTSRISSVGSQGSAVSRLSGASGISRSPSPHKMLVETSFCGPKPIEPTSDASSIEQLTADMLENVILARRGDPTKASLAEGVEIKEPKSTKEKLQEISMTPAEAARAASKEARKKEIEALKARLNAINAKQLEKAKSGGASTSGPPIVKKVIGVTPEGTEYTRIKLKPDHLYDDKGMSPNERVIEESEFKDATGRKEKSRRAAADNAINQISHISPTTHATDNRSPSPASASVSRKSSFCSFFKSKESGNESSSKPRSSSAASGKGRLNDKSPLPSPSKSSSLSSRIAFSLFKTNRNMSPSQIETHDGANLKPITTQQHQSRQARDKPKLKYYDAPDVIHIPLHTPPEEKEFSALKKKNEDDIVAEVVKVPAAPPPPPRVPAKPKIAPTAQIEKMQSTDEIELQELPSRKDDREGGSSLWSVEVQRHSSQESQETVISSQQKNDSASKNGMTEKPAIPAFIDTINENPPSSTQQPMSAKGRHKKHILFSTKIGSGSEEQIFQTQLSLSKTESQSSQLSEQASVFESPKNEESGTNVQETVTRNNVKHQSSSEVEKVTATSARSRRSDQSDSADSRPQSVSRKSRDSGEFTKKRESSDEASHKKRESSDDALRKKRESSDEASRKKRESGGSKLESQSSHSIHSPSVNSQHSQTSLKNEIAKNVLEHQSSGSKMEISSESDRESDMDGGGCVHKRVSRVMEDHESAGLVLQESFDDELPFIPTTLPEERSSGLRIVPTKDRTQNELITIPVERPRSTTPINPASLDNYCERKQSDASDASSLVRGEKLRISLPKQKAEQTKEKVQKKVITRRISNLSNKSWSEFAEQQTASSPATKKVEKSRKQSNSSQDDDPPPPPPPSKSHSKKSLTNKWIDFENIPEKRQPPKKITAIPGNKDPTGDKNHKHGHHHHRQYVSPEECQCECHESLTKKDDGSKQSPAESGKTPTSEDSQPLLDDPAERNSLMR